jgi:hypothetical protein
MQSARCSSAILPELKWWPSIAASAGLTCKARGAAMVGGWGGGHREGALDVAWTELSAACKAAEVGVGAGCAACTKASAVR